MSQHLAIFKGPQGETLRVICASEQEARAAEARWEARKLQPKTDEADEDEGEICPTCGQRKPVFDEEDEDDAYKA
jgi:hypothetical protein